VRTVERISEPPRPMWNDAVVDDSASVTPSPPLLRTIVLASSSLLRVFLPTRNDDAHGDELAVVSPMAAPWWTIVVRVAVANLDRSMLDVLEVGVPSRMAFASY
jgi:hypothetical protein